MMWLALQIALSLPGCAICWRLLRREAEARDLPVEPDAAEIVFGWAGSGLVD